MRARVAVVVVLLSALVFACADLFGFKDLHERDGAVGDVNVPDAGFDAVDECNHVKWPDQPASTEGTGSGAFNFAMRHIYLTSSPDAGSDAAVSFGYDLDNHCTVDQGSSSCKLPTNGTLVKDDLGGVDDESIKLLQKLFGIQSGFLVTLGDSALNTSLGNGDFTILLRIFGYAGGANQLAGSSLSFAFQASTGVESPPAKFDGTDRWYPATQDVLGGDAGTNTPNLLIGTVWVTNHVLVVTYDSPITIHVLVPNLDGGTLSGAFLLILSRSVLTATLVPRLDGKFDLKDGLLTGRWAAQDIVNTVEELTVNSSSPVCTYAGGIYKGAVPSIICPARDITQSGTDDGTQTCDAISVAIGFDAVAANVSGVPINFPGPLFTCVDAGSCP